MLEHMQFLEEKEKVDALFSDGFQITGVKENLSGSFVVFEKKGEKRELHIKTAEGRKYFSTFVLYQQKGSITI